MNSSFMMKCLVVMYTGIFFVSIAENNYPRALYWFGAAVITTSVLWGMK